MLGVQSLIAFRRGRKHGEMNARNDLCGRAVTHLDGRIVGPLDQEASRLGPVLEKSRPELLNCVRISGREVFDLHAEQTVAVVSKERTGGGVRIYVGAVVVNEQHRSHRSKEEGLQEIS